MNAVHRLPALIWLSQPNPGKLDINFTDTDGKFATKTSFPSPQATTLHYYTLYTTIHCLCFVKGFNCEHCMAGYFGDATLGGMCSECTCYTLGTDPERSIENKCSDKSMKV